MRYFFGEDAYVLTRALKRARSPPCADSAAVPTSHPQSEDHIRYAWIVTLLAAACDSGAIPTLDLHVRDLALVVGGCMSGDRDGDETDVDCGGSCTPCDTGKACSA